MSNALPDRNQQANAPNPSSHWRRWLLGSLKMIVPLAIIGFLLYQISDEDWQRLRECNKNWWMLAAAFGIALTAWSISFVRWYLLVVALEIPFRLRDAFRLGFLGFMFNFVSLGVVGGDFFKAIFIAREQQTKRAEAVATVIVDRMIGLYALLVVTSVGIYWGAFEDPSAEVLAICRITWLATGIGGVAILVVLLPGVTNGAVTQRLGNLPKVGPLLERVITAVRMYRRRPMTLVAIAGMSLLIHCLVVFSLHLIANSTVPTPATLSEHFVIVPLSMVAGALPLTPAGLGTMEAAMDYLYGQISSGEGAETWGLLVALVYRMITIAVAVVGAVVYWTSRREVAEVMAAAESQVAEQASAD